MNAREINKSARAINQLSDATEAEPLDLIGALQGQGIITPEDAERVLEEAEALELD